ncbi:helix-turn-helix domain-containing protein [Saccharothrix deserti]|uniref:helix-turn-helix domain-containing protein n=1 Tax=Saccharothrix deserti TaxID=2593674 RepID=UPI00131E630A|nr:helix-turn-helix transcriptional regulator [Saccharothrix deserti]
MSSTFENQRLAFADRLVALRVERTSLAAKDFAASLGWHASKVSRIETGKQTPSDDELRTWLDAVGAPAELVDELRNQLRDLRIAQSTWRRQLRSGHRARQEQDEREEQAAAVIRAVDVMAVPGLVQTPDYARRILVTQAELLEVPAGDVDAAVNARMRRQRVLYEPDRRIELLVAEAALGMAVCPAAEMRAQVDRLQSVIGLPNVRLGVLPLHVQYPHLLPHGYWIVDDEVFIELVHSEVRVNDPEQVAIYSKLTDRLWTVALEGNDARTLLARVAATLQAGD